MERIGDWIQALSNFAVLVGLIFVGVQLYQDRELKRNEMLDLGWHNIFDRQYQIMGEDIGELIAKSALVPNELTHAEHYRLGVYFSSVVSQWRREAMLERVGMRPAGWRRSSLPSSFYTEPGKTFLERFLAESEQESADWSVLAEVRQQWAAEVSEPSFSSKLASRLRALADD